MKPNKVEIKDIRFRRPGLTKVDFLASYNGFLRRGTVVYDTVARKFLSHGKDIELLLSVCLSLQHSSYRES